MSKKPIPIGKLPQYLESLKEDGSTGSSNLVDMGRIVAPKNTWIKPLSLAMLFFVIFGLGGTLTYNLMSLDQLTVIVDVAHPQSIPQIVSDSGGQVLSIQHKEDLIYEVKISTRKSSRSLLEWLRKNSDVRKANLK